MGHLPLKKHKQTTDSAPNQKPTLGGMICLNHHSQEEADFGVSFKHQTSNAMLNPLLAGDQKTDRTGVLLIGEFGET